MCGIYLNVCMQIDRSRYRYAAVGRGVGVAHESYAAVGGVEAVHGDGRLSRAAPKPWLVPGTAIALAIMMSGKKPEDLDQCRGQ